MIGDVRDRRLDVVADELPQGDEDLLGEGDDVGLLDERGLDVEPRELRLTVGAEVLVAVAAGDLVVALHARDLEGRLNRRGDCGGAYHDPGRRRAGTRKSRAPSGVDFVSVGVSISTKPCSSRTVRAARLTAERRRIACAGPERRRSR